MNADGADAAGVRAILDVTALKPLGRDKGQGLAMAISVLCMLADMPLDHELSHFYGEPFNSGRRVSHLFVALEIAAFVPPSVFRKRMHEYMHHVRASSSRVRVPGDLEAAARRDRVEHGIPMTFAEVAHFEQYGLQLHA